MSVGFNNFRVKTDDSVFIVKNITSDRQIKVFNIKLMPGASYDLMNIPFVSEADIKTSLLKGELRTALEHSKIQIVDSTIDLVQYGNDFISFLESNSTVTSGIRDSIFETEIRALRDLPDPVNGVITLSKSNTVYNIIGNVDLGTNELVITGTNTAIIGRNPRADSLMGSTTGTLLSSTRGIQIENIAIINPDGYAINIDGNGTDHIILKLCGLLFSKYAGSIGNALVFHADKFMIKSCLDGLTLNSCTFVSIVDLSVALSPGSGMCFSIQPNQTFKNLSLKGCIIRTQTSQTGIYIDPSTTIENRALLLDNIVYGDGTALGGITKKENRYWFTNNSGILDSQKIGGIGFSGNTTATTISVAGTFVEIGTGSTAPPHSAFTLDAASERLSLQGTFPSQTLQFDGYETTQFDVVLSLSVATSGGAEKTSASRLTLNGSPVAESEFQFITKGAGSVSYSLSLELSNNDKIGIEIANITDTSDLVVYAARLTAFAY